MLNIDEYKKKVDELSIQEITLPSGFVFKIKKMYFKEQLMLTKSMGVYSASQIKHSNIDMNEKGSEIEDSEKIFEMTEALLLKNVIDPPLCSEKEKKGFLCIDLIPPDDYQALVVAIQQQSLATDEKKKINSNL